MNKIMITYLLIINLLGFLIMFIDKNRAIHHEWRISEKNLLLISLIGGSLGMFVGMHIFKHKTKHLKFTIGVPAIFILQIVTAVYIFQ